MSTSAHQSKFAVLLPTLCSPSSVKAQTGRSYKSLLWKLRTLFVTKL